MVKKFQVDKRDEIYKKFEISKCLDVIEALQNNPNHEIYLKAKEIVQAYNSVELDVAVANNETKI